MLSNTQVLLFGHIAKKKLTRPEIRTWPPSFAHIHLLILKIQISLIQKFEKKKSAEMPYISVFCQVLNEIEVYCVQIAA